jgi:hypothetical protein
VQILRSSELMQAMREKQGTSCSTRNKFEAASANSLAFSVYDALLNETIGDAGQVQWPLCGESI